MNSTIIGSFLRLGVYLFLFPFGKCFQAFPEVACFLVSHAPSLPPLIFTNISPILVLSSGLVFIIQGVSWASGYKQQYHVCVCVLFPVLIIFKCHFWCLLDGFYLISQSLLLISPRGCSPRLCGEVTPLRLHMQQALTPPSIRAVISVWNDLAWLISTCPSSV